MTSAARYADQVPWDFLREAAERSASVAIVLDRTPAEAVETVSTHLARMLASRGLKDSPLFIVHEGEVSDDGLLPAFAVADVRGSLETLAADADARDEVVRQTLEGAIRTLTRRTHTVADAAAEQVGAEARLRGDAERAYYDAVAAVATACADARCCAARCWRGGRSSSAPARCCSRPSSTRSAGSATASSTRSRASRRPRSG